MSAKVPVLASPSQVDHVLDLAQGDGPDPRIRFPSPFHLSQATILPPFLITFIFPLRQHHITTSRTEFDASDAQNRHRWRKQRHFFQLLLPKRFRDTQTCDTLQDVHAPQLQYHSAFSQQHSFLSTCALQHHNSTMEIRDLDRNYKSSPRADSFVDTISDDAMDADADIVDDAHCDDVDMKDDDDAKDIIKCICGFGEGYDDDDCVSCEQCLTWQHMLCYFDALNMRRPNDGEHFLCVDCGPSHQVNASLAATEMRKKLAKVRMLTDRIEELNCEVQQRQNELLELESELACVESDWYTKGPLLAAHDSPSAWHILNEWWEEHALIIEEIAKTLEAREGTLRHITAVKNELLSVRSSEKTRLARLGRTVGRPDLLTPVESLGTRSCQERAKCPREQEAKVSKETTASSQGAAVPSKRKKKRVYR